MRVDHRMSFQIEKHDSPLAQLSILFKQNDLVLKIMNGGVGRSERMNELMNE